MKYIPREISVSAFRFGHHIPPKWYIDLLNRGKVFASREHTEKGVELKLKIVLPDDTCFAVPGDWIILDSEGKISVLSHDKFTRIYRGVNDG